MAEYLQVYLLGEFRCYRDGVLLSTKDWHTRQARQLFKLLLTEHGRTVSVRKLISLLWPDYGESAYKTLRSAVSTLRSVLEPDRNPQAPSRFVPRGRSGYRLTFPPDRTIWIDTVEFERLLDEALAGENTPQCRKLLEKALQLYSGDYLSCDEEESWALLERERLRERYFSGVMQLVAWQMEVGLYKEAIVLSRNALIFDACREPLYCLMMQCQANLGDAAGALQTFERCRQALDEHLGADPAPQTLKLHMSILKGEYRPRIAHHTSPELLLHKPTLLADHREPAFVGRKVELGCLMQQLERVQVEQRGTRTVALVGEAGVGKSFLVRLFLGRAQAARSAIMTTACQAIEQNVAFAPLTSLLGAWLREVNSKKLDTLSRATLAQVAPLLPGLMARLPDIEATPPASSEQAHGALIAGLADLFAALAGQGPLILCFDDLQWADESTLLVINRLAYQEGLPLLLLVSYRPEDVSENRSLGNMLRYLSRCERFSTLYLSRFSPQEVTEYLNLYSAIPPLSAEKLYQITQGNALFLAETVRTLLEQKDQQTQDTPFYTSSSILRSQQIRDVVQARMARLPSRAVALLERAAVIGHPFALDLLCPERCSEDEQAVETLLERRFLVEVAPTDGHDISLAFSHDLVREIVYATCSTLKLMQLHRQVAESLAQGVMNHAPTDRGRHAAEIAFHYRQAGPQYVAQVLRYEIEAGDYARHIFSYRQAMVHYDAALAILERLPSNGKPAGSFHLEEWAGRAYEGRILACEALLDWEEIKRSYHRFSRWAAASDLRTLVSNNAHRLAVNRSLLGHLSDAASMVVALVQHLQSETTSAHRHSDRDRKNLNIVMDMTQRWVSLLTLNMSEQPASIATRPFPPFCTAQPPPIQDWHEMIDTLGMAYAAFVLAKHGWTLVLQGLNREAEECLKVALRAAEETDQPTCWILAAMHLSRVYYLYGHYDQATGWLERCIDRCRQLPQAPWAIIWPLLNLAYFQVSVGRLDEGERTLHTLHTQLAGQDDFLAHRYSTQIGFGLLALARSDICRAEAFLGDALAHRNLLYIEAYIFAEVGMATIAKYCGHYDEAHSRLQKMLAFCGQRSLLQYYATTTFAYADLAIETGQFEGVDELLEAVSDLTAAAGYAAFHRHCKVLLGKIPAPQTYSHS